MTFKSATGVDYALDASTNPGVWTKVDEVQSSTITTSLQDA